LAWSAYHQLIQKHDFTQAYALKIGWTASLGMPRFAGCLSIKAFCTTDWDDEVTEVHVHSTHG